MQDDRFGVPGLQSEWIIPLKARRRRAIPDGLDWTGMLVVHPTLVRERFRQLAADDFDESRLSEGALLIAQEDCPGLEIQDYLDRLDLMAARILPSTGEKVRLESICSLLFEEMGFRGNEEEYYDPRNSFLNEVIDRRTGIPITLSILFIHIARGVGLSANAVGLPGHFVVRCEIDGDFLWVDPFYGARRTTAELTAMIRARGREMEPRHLRPWTARETLMRVLANLHNLHTRSGESRRARAARERIDLLAGGATVN